MELFFDGLEQLDLDHWRNVSGHNRGVDEITTTLAEVGGRDTKVIGCASGSCDVAVLNPGVNNIANFREVVSLIRQAVGFKSAIPVQERTSRRIASMDSAEIKTNRKARCLHEGFFCVGAVRVD